ncbi:hypothetical protein FQN53_008203 [Emmonsiellopsis sp. PD_33]|nr:hypothetical protein FQN53_008203 [Emmonsiellopsis sp. PD_33]
MAEPRVSQAPLVSIIIPDHAGSSRAGGHDSNAAAQIGPQQPRPLASCGRTLQPTGGSWAASGIVCGRDEALSNDQSDSVAGQIPGSPSSRAVEEVEDEANPPLRRPSALPTAIAGGRGLVPQTTDYRQQF